MNVVFRHSFTEDLKRIKDKALLKRVRQVIEQMETAATLNQIRNLKKLQGGSIYYRIRVGDYRIGLTVEKETLTCVRFLHRKDIYRDFP